MVNGNLREPKQKRSIEKKQKILHACYKLFCEKGYYNMTTADIAKEAGVSTGIVYSYFADKKDIIICFLEQSYNIADGTYEIYALKEISEMLKNLRSPKELFDNLDMVISSSLKYHVDNSDAAKQLVALSCLDADIGAALEKCDKKLEDEITKILYRIGVNLPNLRERVHVAMDVIEAYSHNSAFESNSYLDENLTREYCVKMIKSLFIE